MDWPLLNSLVSLLKLSFCRALKGSLNSTPCQGSGNSQIRTILLDADIFGHNHLCSLRETPHEAISVYMSAGAKQSLPSREQSPARVGHSTGAFDQEEGVWKRLKQEILSGEQVG